MNKFKRILTIFTVLTFFLLYSVSPVFAEEITGISTENPVTSEDSTENSVTDPATESDAEPEIVEEIVSIEEIPGTAEAPGDNVIDLPADGDEIVKTVVDIGDASAEEPADTEPEIIEEIVNIEDAAVFEEEPTVTDDVTNETESSPAAAENYEYLDNAVLNVVVPISVSVTIDPLELAENGQIYSKVYSIVNDGDTEVLLTFTDIQVIFADDSNFLPMAQPFDELFATNRKAIYMSLDFGREDVPAAILTDTSTGGIVIPLSTAVDEMEDTSTLQFSFSGYVSTVPSLAWQDNDVRISMNYTLQTVVPIVEEIVPILGEDTVTPESIEVIQEAEAPTTEVEEEAVNDEEAIDESSLDPDTLETDNGLSETIDADTATTDMIDSGQPEDTSETDAAESPPDEVTSGIDSTDSSGSTDSSDTPDSSDSTGSSGGSQQTTDGQSEPSYIE